MKSVFQYDTMSHIEFSCCLATVSILLYANTWHFGFVWDDRAAIIANPDVSGTGSMFDTLGHDFWGQNITLADSHKSYRPITTWSYRFNHQLHGLHSSGFHISNIAIYAACVFLFYNLCLKWSNQSTARLAGLIFCFHPIHVEAVSSLVGRADCLCGLFYIISMIAYPRCSEGSMVWSVISLFFAVVASLTKEIGVTVLGVLIVMELLDHAREKQAAAVATKGKHKDSDKDKPGTIGALVDTFSQGLSIFTGAVRSVITDRAAVLRVCLVFSVLIVFVVVRLRINGPHTMYVWSVLDNYITMLPTFKERALSYGQTHFWYAVKLLYPRYLCFDYGYACLPTVQHLSDIRNLLPIATYLSVAGLALYAVAYVRLAVLLGLLWMLLSVLPALNIVFPVGTVLAERLLFIPSMGFSLLMAELLTDDCSFLWDCLSETFLTRRPGRQQHEAVALAVTDTKKPTRENSSKQFKMKSATRLIVIGLAMALASTRIITRNLDWQSEYHIFKSALQVCPNSVKALSNFAAIAISRIATEPESLPAALNSSVRAVQLYNQQAAAHINAGMLYQYSNRLSHSIYHLEQALRVDASNSKAASLLGQSLSLLSNLYMPTEQLVTDLRQRAAAVLDLSIALGANTPQALHVRGSLAIDMSDNHVAVKHLTAAIHQQDQDNHLWRTTGRPSESSIEMSKTLNQLGIALSAVGRDSEATAVFERGLELEPSMPAIVSNLGNHYRRTGRLESAKNILRHGIEHCSPEHHSSLFNNLGLVFMDEAQYAQAASMFEKALEAISRGQRFAGDARPLMGYDNMQTILQANLDKSRHMTSLQPPQ